MLRIALRLPRLRIALRSPRRAIPWILTAIVVAYFVYVFAGTNSHEVIAGRVYRTAQLDGERLAAYIRDRKIRTVINLRGHCPNFDWYLQEAAATAAAGVSQEDITLSANRLPAPNELKRLIDVLDHSEYPIVFHCKQGADRTGLASVIVLLLYTDASLSRARRELWPHRGHFPVSRTVAMDDFFDRYEAWLKGEPHSPARFRDWALHHYKPGPAVADLGWVTPIPPVIASNKPFALTLRATNRSDEPWHFKPGSVAGINLQYRLYRATGELAVSDVAGLLRRTVNPGESIDLLLAFPKLAPGRYLLRAELADFTGAALAVRAKYFFQFGCDAMLVELDVK